MDGRFERLAWQKINSLPPEFDYVIDGLDGWHFGCQSKSTPGERARRRAAAKKVEKRREKRRRSGR